jgi:hypothetical protein
MAAKRGKYVDEFRGWGIGELKRGNDEEGWVSSYDEIVRVVSGMEQDVPQCKMAGLECMERGLRMWVQVWCGMVSDGETTEMHIERGREMMRGILRRIGQTVSDADAPGMCL